MTPLVHVYTCIDNRVMELAQHHFGLLIFILIFIINKLFNNSNKKGNSNAWRSSMGYRMWLTSQTVKWLLYAAVCWTYFDHIKSHCTGCATQCCDLVQSASVVKISTSHGCISPWKCRMLIASQCLAIFTELSTNLNILFKIILCFPIEGLYAKNQNKLFVE